MTDDEPISVHRANPVVGFFRSQAAPLFITVLPVMLAFAGFFLPWKEGPVVAKTTGAISVVAALGCLVWALVAYSMLIKYVAIYPDRVEWRDSRGEQIAAWGDLKNVWRTEIIVNGNMQTRQVVIETRDGVKATFMYILSDWAGMAERIQVETADLLGPPALAKYDAGEKVKFGDLSIDRRGVTLSGKTYAWDQLERTGVENGHYCLYKHGEQYTDRSIALGQVPNILVLFRVLERTPLPPTTPMRKLTRG